LGVHSTSVRSGAWRAPRAWRALLAVREPRALLELLVPEDPLELRALVGQRLEARALVLDAGRALVQSFARLAAALRPGLRTRAKGGLGVGPAWLVFVVDEALDALAVSLVMPRSAEATRCELSASSPWNGEARVLAAFARRPQHERRTAFDVLLGRRGLETLARAQRCSVQSLAERTLICLTALGEASASLDVIAASPALEPLALGSVDHDDERLLARLATHLRAPARHALRLLRLVHAVRRGAPGAVEVDEVERALVELERARCAEAVRTLLGAALKREVCVDLQRQEAVAFEAPASGIACPQRLGPRDREHADSPYFEATIATLRDLAPTLAVPIPPLTPFVEPRVLVSGLIESLAALAQCQGPRVVARAEVDSWRLRLADLEVEASARATEPPAEARHGIGALTRRDGADRAADRGEAPVDAPADAPIDVPVDAPVDVPVDAPVDAHTVTLSESLRRSARARVDELAQAVAALVGCSARSSWQLLHAPAALGRRGRAHQVVCAASASSVDRAPASDTGRARSPRGAVAVHLPTPFGAPLVLRVLGSSAPRPRHADGEAEARLLAALEVALASQRDLELGGTGFVLPIDEPGAREAARRALELCRAGAPLVLAGPSGSGRRTFARWLHVVWLQRTERGGTELDPRSSECQVFEGESTDALEAWLVAAFTAAAVPDAAPVCLCWPDGAHRFALKDALGAAVKARLLESTVRLPALADARQRIPALARHQLDVELARRSRAAPRVVLDDDALAALWRAEWPGNGHDLGRVVARLAAEVTAPERSPALSGRIRAQDVAGALESVGLVPVERRPLDCGAHELAAALWATRTPRGRRNLLRAASWLGWDRGTLADRLHGSARDPAELLRRAVPVAPLGSPADPLAELPNGPPSGPPSGPR